MKFVKLLFLLLKKHIDRFIEHKNAHAKCHQTAAKQRKQLTKNASSTSAASTRVFDKKFHRHGMPPDLEQLRAKARRNNKEHEFYKTALHC